MNNNIKKISKVVLFGLSICLLSTTTLASNDDEKSNGDVNEKYVFPVTTGTKEWEELKTTNEMISLTQIPEKLLKSMTTEALVETVIDYPLLSNIFVYNSSDEALNIMKKQFNGVDELFKREDGVSKLLSYYQNKSLNRNFSEGVSALEIEWILTSKTALEKLNDNELSSLSLLSNKISYSKNTKGSCSIKTPKGSCVNTIINSELSSSEIKRINQSTSLSYPAAKMISSASARYNCHSYAYYSESTANNQWINSPNPYFSDYSFRTTTRRGNRIRGYYPIGGHSAIFVNNTLVKSKWGQAGVYQHNYNYGPYDANMLRYYEKWDFS